MLNDFQSVNNSLSEDLYQQAKSTFDQQISASRKLSFDKLPQLLHSMKIPIPESMTTEINRCLRIFPLPSFTFKAFTHFVARATLEQQLQEQIRNLFYHIDRKKTGRVDAEDLSQFIHQLQGGQLMGQGSDELLRELDFMKIGYLNYEDFVYQLLPK